MPQRKKSGVKNHPAEAEPLPAMTDDKLLDRLLEGKAFRAKIDAKLADAEARGGEAPLAVVFAELGKKYGW